MDKPKKKKGNAGGDPPKKSGNTLLFAGIGAGVVVLLVGCCGCTGIGWYFRSSLGLGEKITQADADRDGKPAQDKLKDGAKDGNKGGGDVAKIDAEALSREILSNAFAAKRKYQGKSLEVTGVVERVTEKNAFIMKGSHLRPTHPIINFQCTVEGAFAAKSARLARGQKIKVVCVPGDRFSASYLEGCSLTELEPSKITVTPALEVINEFSADLAGTTAKYKAVGLIVSGSIQNVQVIDGFNKEKWVPNITLEAGKGKVTIGMTDTTSKSLYSTRPKVGDYVEIRCAPQPTSVILGTAFFPGGFIVRQGK